jgi:hypothetical protein
MAYERPDVWSLMVYVVQDELAANKARLCFLGYPLKAGQATYSVSMMG